jgi:regulator of sirC expression with transglutaminase-like and TPR domain
MYQRLSDLDYFRLLVRDPDSIPLLESAAAIATDAYPSLDLQQTLADFDALARRLASACAPALTETARLQQLLKFFFSDQGFAGNLVDYYDPDNSYIHRVLETRRGIPITLAVVLVELARHIGLDADGVSFPGHFLARIDLHEGLVVIDPFSGTSLDLDEIEARARPHGLPIEQLLAPASSVQILTRMLNNLHAIHSERGDMTKLAQVGARLQALGQSVPG